MRGRRWLFLVAVFGVGGGGALAAPVPEDFAEGVPLVPTQSGSAYQLRLPEPVYALSTRSDLGDIRVFNRAGQVVQHALCAPPEERRTHAHPVVTHGLPPGRAGEAPGVRLAIDTADGLRVRRWQQSESQAAATASGDFEYILDTREVKAPITELRLDWRWRSPEGREELPIRVDASEDLKQWRTVVRRSTLLRVGDEALENATVALPERTYGFLRLIPEDERARDWLQGAAALTTHTDVDTVPLTWVAAERRPGAGENATAYLFERSRPTLARQWRLRLPGPNRVVRVRLDSRADASAAWHPRFRGTVASGPDAVVTGAHAIGPTADRFWRLEIVSGTEALAGAAVALELGYRPLRLGFMAQGESPFLLAYGGGRVAPAQTLDCSALGEHPVVARAELGERRTLGGEAALRPPPETIPVRRLLLWGVLILGAVLVAAMAVALLARLRD